MPMIMIGHFSIKIQKKSWGIDIITDCWVTFLTCLLTECRTQCKQLKLKTNCLILHLVELSHSVHYVPHNGKRGSIVTFSLLLYRAPYSSSLYIFQSLTITPIHSIYWMSSPDESCSPPPSFALLQSFFVDICQQKECKVASIFISSFKLNKWRFHLWCHASTGQVFPRWKIQSLAVS